MATLLWLATNAGKGKAETSTYRAGIKAVSANPQVPFLFCNEHIISSLFLLFGACPRRAPLLSRILFVKGYPYGGIHSACGVAATVWYIAYLTQLTRDDLTATSPSVLH